ncbi:MAG: hypothetical protein KGO96_13725 [Elusimicrobia bacterium]|nr:hypothetical protein [Elusimicrobiota bacterium]MDE2236252.1 hypothetical protein [Elusimicrobiota bacterium]MDE2426954.1 hypothetical protein [Elusimicrobiota bacterium]
MTDQNPTPAGDASAVFAALDAAQAANSNLQARLDTALSIVKTQEGELAACEKERDDAKAQAAAAAGVIAGLKAQLEAAARDAKGCKRHTSQGLPPCTCPA